MSAFEGRTVIVTGGGGGIGGATCRRFAKAGARVAVLDRNAEAAGKVAHEIGAAGGTAAAIACDITDRAQVFAMMEAARAWHGHLDIAVNATGWGFLKPFLDNTEDELARITALQFIGPFYFCQAAVEAMREAFDRRRRAMVGMLNDIEGVVCPVPKGAFYAYPSVAGVLGKTIRGRTPMTSAELATLILEEVEVAVVPGEAFGPSGYLRLSYALGDEDLKEGVGRIQALLGEAR